MYHQGWLLLGYCLHLVTSEDEAPPDNGGGEPPAVNDDSVAVEPAQPGILQQVLTYGIGVLFGLGLGLGLLWYFCRPGQDVASSAQKSTNYAKLSTEDLERGSSIEITNRTSSRSSSSEEDTKNWDDWEEVQNKSEGEFFQHSNQVSASVPRSSPPLAMPSRNLDESFPTSTSTTSLSSRTTSRSGSPGTKRRASPKRPATNSAPIGDDLFESIGISAKPKFTEAVIPATSATRSRASQQRGPRVSDIVVDDDQKVGAGGGWVDHDDDLDI